MQPRGFKITSRILAAFGTIYNFAYNPLASVLRTRGGRVRIKSVNLYLLIN